MIETSALLYVTDFSDLSLHALEYAQFLAKKMGAKLHVLHVVDDSYQYWIATDMIAAPVGPPIEELMGKADEMLGQFVTNNLGQDIEVTRAIRHGRPFAEIIQYAKEQSIGMIVMGTHGRTGLKHVLLGSVADKAVHKSTCPVLTVRSPGDDPETT